MNKLNLKLSIVIALIVVAALFRILPHIPNTTPLAAMGIFGAAQLKNRWQAFLIPFIALFLSDLYLNNVVYTSLYEGKFQWITSAWQYVAFGLLIASSQLLLKKINTTNIVKSSVVASVIFFIVSNLGTFFDTTFNMYSKDVAGLIACFTAAIPFFGATLVGDLCYSLIIFGAYYMISIWALKPSRA